MKRLGLLAALALVLCPLRAQDAQAGGRSAILETGSFVSHMLLHAIGQESYVLSRTRSGGLVLRDQSQYSDRGRSSVATAELRLGADLRPLAYESQRANGKESFSYPAAVQMMLVRWWLAHGQPADLAAPGAAAAAPPIQIRREGGNTLQVNGRAIPLERFTLGGAVYGREVLWLDARGHLAALMTFGGGLPWEYIATEYEPQLPQLFQWGVAQELSDLDALDRAVPAEAEGTFALVGATLIDGTGAAPVPDAAVVVRDGRIVAAGPRASVAIPPGTRVIEAAGKTLIPGLWEMHTHYSGVEFGPAQLAAGITSARDCGGEFAFLVAVRDAIARRHALGPRLLLAGLLDAGGLKGFGSTLADTPAEGRAAVDRYHAAGFVQMKLYNQLQPDVILAVTTEAHRLGMSVTGHVPDAINALQGIELGMDQINHLGYVTPVLRDGNAPFDADSERARSSIAFLVRHHTVVDPTQSWTEMASHPADMPISSFEPGILNAPYALRVRYEGFATPAAGHARFLERMAANRREIAALHAAGVHLVAGSDTGLLGYGLDRELEIYVQSGLTPMQAIQVATLGSAEALGLEAESGSIAPGKRADLVLLNANPLDNISNLRQVDKVIAAGRMYDSVRLRASVGFR